MIDSFQLLHMQLSFQQLIRRIYMLSSEHSLFHCDDLLHHSLKDMKHHLLTMMNMQFSIDDDRAVCMQIEHCKRIQVL